MPYRINQGMAPQPERNNPAYGVPPPSTTVSNNNPQARGAVVSGGVSPVVQPPVQPAPRVVAGSGAYDPTGGFQQPRPQPLPQVGGGEARPTGRNYYDLQRAYENRLAAGGGGQQFLNRHPRFANRYSQSNITRGQPVQSRNNMPQSRGFQVRPHQGMQNQGRGPQVPYAPQPNGGQPAPVAPGAVVTGGGSQVHTQPPPGSAVRPDGSIDLPTGWAGIGGPDGNLVYVEGWNQMTPDQQLQLVSEIKGQDWMTPAGGQLQNYGPGIAATGGATYGDQGYATSEAAYTSPYDAPMVQAAPQQGFAPTMRPTGPQPAGPRVIPGGGTQEPGYMGSNAPQISGGSVEGRRTGQGLNYNQLENRYENRLAGGRGGEQFMQNHPKFARNYGYNNRGQVGGGAPLAPGPRNGPSQGSPNTSAQRNSRGQNRNSQNQNRPRTAADDVADAAGVTAAGEPNNPPAFLGLPNSPEYIEMRRMLDDELSATLLSIGVARDQIPAALKVIEAELATDQRLEHDRINEDANARGVYQSGIPGRNRDIANIGFSRAWQDALTGAQGQYNDLAQQELAAQSEWRRGIQEGLLDYSGDLYDSPPSTIDRGNSPYPDEFDDETKGTKGKKNDNGRRRGNDNNKKKRRGK